MRFSLALPIAAICAAGTASSQAQRRPAQSPALPPTAASAAGFAPRGWTVETEARGDLNGDGRSDLAFVLTAPDVPGARPRSGPDGDPGSYANPRILAVAFAGRQGGYRLAVGNQRFLPPKWAPNGLSQGWMLFEPGSVDIVRGRLRIIFQYTRSNATFTFRWQAGALRLIGYDSVGVEAGCLHALSVNFLTGRARMAAHNIEEDEERPLWRRVPKRPLLSVEEIGEGEEFDPYGLSSRFTLRCRVRE
jgi:hypothetical protein